ncbi:Site-specific recombinase XerD [Selenomonas ruminantium]|uniref:Site-specific recombinase XerD n=1 Tax=Selenomonas ruminantium TaxID=971 RepID=A0A1M6W1N9_SELRU|nr:site-specific integrase [Selenomonas ruminantium]SHK87654.1 Site-specific recombinase XerD [Selenomonas ruminantium]
MRKRNPDTTMEEIAQAWLIAQKSRVKSSTNAIYHYGWQHYLSPIFGTLQPARITEQLVQKYLQAKRNLSALTLRNQVILLRNILKFAQEKYGIATDYKEICLPAAYGERLIIANTTWRRLQHVIQGDDSLIADCIALASLTGIRLGECCALQCMDIDEKERLIYIRHTVQRIRTTHDLLRTRLVVSSPKSKKSRRIIPIPDKLWTRIQRICIGKEKTDFIFGSKDSPMDPRRLQYQFAQYLRRHKIKDFNFHQLRHKFATCCLEQKMDIKVLSELLGHSSVSVTLNYYVHPDLNYKRRQINKFANAYQ